MAIGTIRVSDTILSWLDGSKKPKNCYELLNQSLFEPDLELLGSAVASCSRRLLPYQSHEDREIARRAMRLITDLGAADVLISRPQTLMLHNEQIAEQLLERYKLETGLDSSDWDRNVVAQWLIDNHGAHPTGVLKVLARIWDDESVENSWSESASDEAGPIGDPHRTSSKKPVVDPVPVPMLRHKRRRRRRRRSSSQRSVSHHQQDSTGESSSSERSSVRRSSGRRSSGSRSASKKLSKSKRARRQAAQLLAGLATFLSLVALLAYWLTPTVNNSATCIVLVSPSDAEVIANNKMIKVTGEGGRRILTLANAEGLAEPIEVRVMKSGYKTHGFQWQPTPKSTIETEINLPALSISE